jgi:hypothetical protein
MAAVKIQLPVIGMAWVPFVRLAGKHRSRFSGGRRASLATRLLHFVRNDRLGCHREEAEGDDAISRQARIIDAGLTHGHTQVC